MERLSARTLAVIRESLSDIREGSLEPAPANLAEIAWLAQACDLAGQRLISSWLVAVHARERSRSTRDRSSNIRERAQRLRARSRLTVVEGAGAAGGW